MSDELKDNELKDEELENDMEEFEKADELERKKAKDKSFFKKLINLQEIW